MLREIFTFELRYQLRQPIFWLAAAVFSVLTFGAVASDAVTIGGSIGNVDRNAPFVIMQILLVMSVVGVFVTTAFVAGTVLRDFELGTRELLFATPMAKRDYLLGRFGGALAVSLALFVPVAGAIALGGFMPWLDPERIGPFVPWHHLWSLLVLVFPNVLLTAAVFFALATLTRSMMATYAGVVAFFVAYAVSGNLLADLENDRLASLLDPFGFAAFTVATKYWTVAERNTEVLALEGPFLWNRLVWMGVGLLLFAVTYALFSFEARESRRKRRRRERGKAGATGYGETAEAASAEARPRAAGTLVPRAAPSFTAATAWRQLLHQVRVEVGGVVAGLPFLVLVALGILNVVGNSTAIDSLYGTPVWPVTQLMLRIVEGSFLLYVVIIVTFYAGELVFRERSLGIDEVSDALPVPSWVFWGGKLTALFAVVVLLLAVAALTSIGVQAWHGWDRFEPALYAQGLGLVIGIPFLQMAVLALFFQVLTHHKYAGYLLMVLYFLSFPVLSALDLDHNLYRYAGTPNAIYSDLAGYGPFVEPVAWFSLYWSLGAAALVILLHLLWVRGTPSPLGRRLAALPGRLAGPAGATLAAVGMAFAAVGGWIFYNTNIVNEYVPGDVREERQAEYEKRYERFDDLAQPRIRDVYAEVDLYPERRAVDVRGRYRLANPHAEPISELHLVTNPEAEIRELAVPGAELAEDDPTHGYRIYRFSEPLAPGAELELSFEVAIENRGFVNSGFNLDVVGNGTFFNNFEYFPRIGYQDGGELEDPNVRREHGLPPVERMAPLEDEAARFGHYVTDESDWIGFETVVSTSPDQTALAPGYLQREWVEGGRRYFHYAMDAPILGFFSYLSADWEVTRDRWGDVAIEIYHHPDHAMNVPRMIEGVKKSLDYFTEAFGPYQHRQVRIVEFPRYAQFAQSFPNTIPFSEGIGFIARLDEEEAIDYVFYVTAHEVAHQWWAHQVIGGDVQGATVLTETMSQYSALMVMEREYGREKMRRFLKYELDSYLSGRGGELIEELPLVRVENQGYIHYRKGSLAMYALRDAAGEEELNRAVRRFADAVRYQEPPYTTSAELLGYLAEAVPPERSGLIEDLFETITLWENRAREAVSEPTGDGRYRVRVTVEAAKYRADGEGRETEIPVDDWVDVAVFGEETEGSPPEGEILYLDKVHLDEAERTIELVVDSEPRRAGVDPFNKLIDRNPENNLVEVEG